jgi:hypothetical protein
MRRLTAVATSAAVLFALAGCGTESTGPSQNPEGWNEYTEGGFTFEWMVNDTTSTLHVRMTAPTTGWVAAGFDPQTVMLEANLIIGYVSGSDTELRDDWGTGQHSHAADTALGGTDNVTLVDGSESSGQTVIEFTIPMDSGDAYDKALVEGTTYNVILAYGANGADDFTSAHAFAVTVSLEI